MTYYMIGADGNRIGPVEASELVRYGLTPSTLVWREGLQDWIPASSEPGLAAYLAPAASTPPTPQRPIAQPFNSSIAEGPRNPQFCNPQPSMSKPDNYLVWAILSTLFCCMPFGIVSIIYSCKVNGLWEQGRYDEARKAANNAKTWALASAGCGLLIFAFYFVVGLLGAL